MLSRFKIHAASGLGALLALVACAGHSTSSAGDPGDELGKAGALPVLSDGSAGAARTDPSADPSSAGGSASKPTSEGTAGGSAPEAGAAGYVSPIQSGARTCENADYCFGLACYAPDHFEPAVCVAPCESDADCAPSEACVRSARLEPTCYARCASPSDCEYHFDCLDFSAMGSLVCFPTAWAVRLSELSD